MPGQPRLNMRCTVERDQGGSDPYGGGTDWQTHLEDEPCFWWAQTGREQISDERSVVTADEHLMVGRDVDLAEGDRIVEVVDMYGRTIVSRARTVEYVDILHSHLDASIRAVA